MNIFKLDVGKKHIHHITKENIEQFTYRRSPWLQNYEGKKSWFAVCPGCDNPIQIVGLYSDKILPYGKHFVPQGLLEHELNGVVDELARDFCNYYSGRKPYNGTYKRDPESPLAKAIFKTLIEQFDRVIYILEKTIGIKISVNLATQMLKDYKTSYSWLYPSSTLDNIPWVFASMSPARTIIGRKILDNEMFTVLKKKFEEEQLPIKFEDNNQIITEPNDDGKFNYSALGFCLIHHKQDMIENTLKESINLIVFTKSGDDAPPPVYSKTINFEHEYFRNLINSNNGYRKMWLVELARQIMLNHLISNFKSSQVYLFKKLKNPELCEYLPTESYTYISFTLEKNLKYTFDNDPYIEIIVTYKQSNRLQRHYIYFYNNSRYICFETLDTEKRNSYGSFSKSSSWLFLPSVLQSYKLGSLLLYECIAFRDEFYPSLKLTPLTLSYDKDTNPENEARRNKLYENFGYIIKDYKAVHSGVIADIADKSFGYDITILENNEMYLDEL